MRYGRDPVLERAINLVGGLRAVGKALGVTFQAVGAWNRCPRDHVLKLAQITGIPRSEIRPDLYPKEG